MIAVLSKVELKAFHALLWWVRTTSRKYRITSISTLIIGLVTAVHFLFLIPEQLRYEQNVRAEKVLKSISLKAAQLKEKQIPPQSRSLVLLSSLPRTSSAVIDQFLSLIKNSAETQNIVMDKASYQLFSEENSSLNRYEVTLPIRTTYPQLRRFIFTVLGEAPNVALNSVTINRSSAGDPILEVQLQLVIFLRGSD